MKNPEHFNHPKSYIIEGHTYTGRPDGDIFAVGNPVLSQEVTYGRERLLLCESKTQDEELADIAGWSTHNAGEIPQETGTNLRVLRIPTGTRTARSVLGGYEAWSGEKAAVLDHITEYEKRVKEKFGPDVVDISVGLGSVARTRDGEFFITPPHALEKDSHKSATWIAELVEEAQEALQHTTSFRPAEHIVEEFKSKLEGVIKGKAKK